MSEDKLPPPLLYNYSPGGAWLPACLAGSSLKFSSRLEFNDPFDSRPAYQVDPGPVGRRYIHEKLKRGYSFSPAKRAQELSRLHKHTRVPRAFSDIVTDQLLDSVGILCLTEDWDEPLFWGHYAAKHSGICIGFRTDRDVFQLAERICYQSELPVILRPSDSNNEMVRKAFLTKSEAWKDEKEWRILKHKRSQEARRQKRELLGYLDDREARMMADQQGPGFYTFDPSAVESITMGMNISPADEKWVTDCVQKAPHAISLFKAIRHDMKYKIDRKWVRVGRLPR